ncbi:PspC domain-containing protein [Olivibacter sp. SDN3]|uniref:PspC domain-containing protein n=1 Tax=Olivibacter sp. SDN3 TaxID=2764720 RepID=UPI001651A034|nr:PspC domain-containing protein [Olivibacter sp. SDN3]QNL51459.1 PspC domain-containing protein [Olivibacter sp. SDN3]
MEKELRRNEQEGMIGGVCAGLAEYVDIDKTWVRLLFILSIFLGFSGFGIVGPIIYVVMWAVLPKKPFVFPDISGEAFNQETPVAPETYDREKTPYQNVKNKRDSDKRLAGIILLVIGAFLLIIQLDIITWTEIMRVWPVVFVVLGIFTISTSFERRKVAEDRREYTIEGDEEEATEEI